MAESYPLLSIHTFPLHGIEAPYYLLPFHVILTSVGLAYWWSP